MNNKRMLIVDGDPIQARVLTRVLRTRHFEVTSVRDSQSAIADAVTNVPDYVILEQQLAGVSGLTLIRPLRDINPAVKIMVLTNYPSIPRAVDSIKLGACNYMAKPAYVDEVLHGLGIGTAPVAIHPGSPAADKTHTLTDLEWQQILRALNDHDGNISAAARTLNMHRRTLQRKIESRQKRSGRDIVAGIRTRQRQRHRREKRAISGV